MERTISGIDKLQETEAIRSTSLVYLLCQRRLVTEQWELTLDPIPQTSSSLVLDGLIAAYTNSMETIPTYKYIQWDSKTRWFA